MISSVSFGNRYVLNANQVLKDAKTNQMRDYLLGVYSSFAKNGEDQINALKKFYMGNEYSKNPKAPFEITLDMPNDCGTQFEQAMQHVGQNFSRIA